jgi:cation transport ATPase
MAALCSVHLRQAAGCFGWAGSTVSVSVNSVLIFCAIFFAVFGVLVWWLSRRRGTPESGVTIFLGIAGVYIGGLWAAMKSERWLTVPGVAMILASYAFGFAARRRRSARSDQTTPDADGSPRR